MGNHTYSAVGSSPPFIFAGKTEHQKRKPTVNSIPKRRLVRVEFKLPPVKYTASYKFHFFPRALGNYPYFILVEIGKDQSRYDGKA